MFHSRYLGDAREVYFIGDSSSRHDIARTVSGRRVDRKNVLRRSGGFFAILLTLWVLVPMAWGFAISHTDSEGNTPEGMLGVLVVLAIVFAAVGSIVTLMGTIFSLVDGAFKSHWSDLKTLRGTDLSLRRERCVVIVCERSTDHLYEGPASMKALIAALSEREVAHPAMEALRDKSEMSAAIKPLVDAFLTATIKADSLLQSGSLSEEARGNLQRSLDGLAALCADKISGIIMKHDEDAALRLQEAADEDELQAIQETVKLAEQLKVDAMLALSDMQVANLGAPVLPR